MKIFYNAIFGIRHWLLGFQIMVANWLIDSAKKKIRKNEKLIDKMYSNGDSNA